MFAFLPLSIEVRVLYDRPQLILAFVPLYIEVRLF
jgi:hypothetical protein